MNYKKQITEILNQWKADNNLVGNYEDTRMPLSEQKLGCKNPMKNEAYRLKMGETRRRNQKGIGVLYKAYKANEGTVDFNTFRRRVPHGEITF